MRRPYSRLAAACALAVATAVLAAGSAFAGGNPNAPGQQKKAADQAQTQQSSSQTQSDQAQAATPTQSQMPSAQHVPPGQAKKQQAGTSSSTQASSTSTQHSASHASVQASSSTQAGVKPSSTTTHWTHCITGGSSATGVTCTASDNGHTPQTGPDVSKRYGNGQTAAQIAVSRGGIGVQLTGPGNSQPHKVSVCGKPNNPSGGVDVHAVKSYSNLHCQPTQKTSVSVTSTCGQTVVVTTTMAGIAHGHGEGLAHNKHMQVTSSTSVLSNGQVCTSTHQQAVHEQVSQQEAAQQQTSQHQQVQQQTSSSNTSSSNTSSNTSQSSQAPVTQAAAPTTKSKGGVLGASKTLTPRHAAPARHGVLGTVTRVAGSTLPFTGFPVWLAVLIALGLIGAGLGLRRRATATRL